ncbi:branched-chain amino acid ABC transporter permease [Mesorhizobium sp. M8A.F.Ca.ET.173.01.1.1]|nr:branched-chain amino acid ABC transporter permease [Mesorhizobium sp. M8A.F.Ca.ET.173.01.1.1]
MGIFLQTLYSGLVIAAVYALMAVGLTLIWGALRVLNLSHGALMMAGAYASWFAVAQLGLPWFLGLPAAFLVVAMLGMVLYKALIGPLSRRPGAESNTFIATAALASAMEGGALLVFGPRNKAQPFAINGSIDVLGVPVTYQQLAIIVVAIITLLTLEIFLKQSRFGLAIRATAQQPDAAQLMGIRRDTVFLLVLALSGALAAVGGVLLSSIYFISPTFGLHPMLKSFIVCILGGLGNMRGTLYAAAVMGLTEAFVSLFFGVQFALPAMFALVILVLIVRPHGLFGRGEVVRL